VRQLERLWLLPLIKQPPPGFLFGCRKRLNRPTRLGSSRRTSGPTTHFVSRFVSSGLLRNTVPGPQLPALYCTQRGATNRSTLRKCTGRKQQRCADQNRFHAVLPLARKRPIITLGSVRKRGHRGYKDGSLKYCTAVRPVNSPAMLCAETDSPERCSGGLVGTLHFLRLFNWQMPPRVRGFGTAGV